MNHSHKLLSTLVECCTCMSES